MTSIREFTIVALTVALSVMGHERELAAPQELPTDGQEIVLVKNGKPIHNMICLPNDEADPAAVLALKEYRSLVMKATGNEPTRVEKPVAGVPTIFFGRNSWSTEAGVTTEELPSEGFRIRSVGQDIHIVGRDTPKVGAHQVAARLGMEPGTLYGTYEFLERYYGMLFAWHDDLGTITPPQKDLTVKSMHFVDAPDCSYRQFTKSPDGQANEIFGRRLRLGHPLEVRHEHNWHRIMSPDVYGKEHPEWFAEIDGQRYAKHYSEKRGGQVCTSNPQVVEHFAKAAIAHFNKYPTADMFSIAANDGRKFCTCRQCEALDSGRVRPDGRRVLTDRFITFSNQVAEQVAKVHPEKRLGVIIYLDYKYAPKNVKPHPMLFLVHPTNSGFSQGAFYEGDEWSEAAMERGWHKAAGTFYKYDIWHYDQTPLYMIAPVTKHLIEKCRAQKNHGVDGGYHYIARSYELLGAGHYLLGRMLWDNDFDAEAEEKKYYAALYGAAADDVKAYYDLMEASLVKVFKDGPEKLKNEAMIASFFNRYPGANNPGIYLAAYWPILGDMKDTIDQAYSKKKLLTPDENERLVRLIDHHNYTMHTVASMVLAGRGLTGSATIKDRKGYEMSKAKRDAAIARIATYQPSFVKLIAEMDESSHTGVLYGKKPTIEVRRAVGFQRVVIINLPNLQLYSGPADVCETSSDRLAASVQSQYATTLRARSQTNRLRSDTPRFTTIRYRSVILDVGPLRAQIGNHPLPDHPNSLRQLLLASCLASLLLATRVPEASGETSSLIASRFQAQHDDYVEDFQKSLAELIDQCRSKNLIDAVTEMQPWQNTVDVSSLSDRQLPRAVQPDILLSLPLDERLWRIQFRSLRQELAKNLYLLSRRVLNAGNPHAAWRLIHEVVWYDSDYERARTLLGYERYGDEWVTPFAAKKLRDRFVWHDRFGWLPSVHIERYENGERFFRNRWYTAQKEAELRREWVHAWEIETDNYLLKTNVGLEEGVALAKKLEVFHDWFQRAFPAFFNTPAQLKALFGSATRRRMKRDQFVVHYYRSKEEYVRRLIEKNPQIAISNGIYSPDEHISHFYVDSDSDIESTIYHEATHQILYELDPKPRQIAEREHFWIIEGFACYIESFRPRSNGVSIGNPDYVRFYFAKQNLVKDGFFVPLDRFASLSKNAYQDPVQISARYSQASGLVHFYMHYNGGQYRDALIDHFAALYRPLRDGYRVGGMDQFTGVPYDKLGQQYRDYIEALDTNPQRLLARPQ